jgi:rare lipoprotein A
MRRIVLSVACFCALWTAARAQSIQRSSESGFASWYGAPYHGQPSASGEIYDQEQLTAAHRTLPFGTRVRVRRLDRGGSVVVRINDRGPFVKSRVIDLSHAAAVRLGMTDGGVAPVILEVVGTPPIDPRHL